MTSELLGHKQKLLGHVPGVPGHGYATAGSGCNFYLMHIKVVMNITILGVQIIEGLY